MDLEDPVSEAIDGYVPPVLRDYGSLVEITAGINFQGPEDGGSKIDAPHHSGIFIP